MKNVAIYGNCQANALGGLLKISSEFSESYFFERTTPVHRIPLAEHANFLERRLPDLDLLICQPVSQKFRGGGYGTGDLINQLPCDCKVIFFPSLQFYGYLATSFPIKNLPLPVAQKIKEIFGVAGADLFHSSQIIEGFITGKKEHETLDVFLKGGSNDKNQVQKKLKSTLDIIEAAEKENSINIPFAEFCRNNFFKTKLFHSPRHPTGITFEFIVNHILSFLELKLLDSERDKIVKRDPLKHPVYPIQPFICEALNLEFDGGTKFMSKTKELDFKDLVSAFYELYTMTKPNILMKALSDYKKSTNYPFTGDIEGESKGSFKNGLKEGTWEYYWDNGELRIKGNFKNGLRIGVWEGYHPEKKLVYKSDKMDNRGLGSWMYIRQLMFKGKYQKGKKDGTWYWYWPKDGVMKAEPKEYKNGKEVRE